MAIEANTPNDWGMRGATNTTLPQFQGVPRQLVVNIDDGYRPVIMDGSTLGGKFKCVSSEELTSGLATKLGKTEKAESAKIADSATVAQSANSIAGANVSGTVANATNAITAQNATKATQDNNGNIIIDTYATKTEVSSGLADKLGITDKAESAKIADSASSVPWNGVSGKPSFATVATSGNYNDLTNKPTINSGILNQIFNTSIKINNRGTITITNVTPNKLLYIILGCDNINLSVKGVIQSGIDKPNILNYIKYDSLSYSAYSDINNSILRYTISSTEYQQSSNGYTVVLPNATAVSLVLNLWSIEQSNLSAINSFDYDFGGSANITLKAYQ